MAHLLRTPYWKFQATFHFTSFVNSNLTSSSPLCLEYISNRNPAGFCFEFCPLWDERMYRKFTLSKCPQTVSPQLQGSVSSCAVRASEEGKGLLWCFVSQTLGLYGHLLQCLWCENVAGLEDHHLNPVLVLEVGVQPRLDKNMVLVKAVKGEDYDLDLDED